MKLNIKKGRTIPFLYKIKLAFANYKTGSNPTKIWRCSFEKTIGFVKANGVRGQA